MTKSVLTTDPMTRNGFIFSLLLWLLAVLYLAFYFNRLTPEVPLFYSLARGDQELASKNFILFLPCVSLLFIAAHLLISHLVISADRVMARLLSLGTIMITFIFAIAWIHVVFIVI